MRYLEVLGPLMANNKTPVEDEIEALAEMYVAGLLTEPNEVTHYAYDAEVLRKRDRLAEAINAVDGKSSKKTEMDKGLRYWSAMTGYYADFVSQGAELESLKSAGVEQVQRHEMDDAKTCRPCREADGKIYDIDKIPPLPHLHCRRWFTPAKWPVVRYKGGKA